MSHSDSEYFQSPPVYSVIYPPCLCLQGELLKQVFVRRRGDQVVIKFNYDKELVEVARSLREREFDPATKEWASPLYLYKDVVKSFEMANCVLRIDEEIERMLLNDVRVERKLPEVRLSKMGNELFIDFDYDESLVRTIKSLPEKSFDPERKIWTVPIRDPKRTLEEVIYRFQFAECNLILEEDLKQLLES